MRFLRQLCVLFLLASISSAHAQSRTDAQNDGFAGPIKSVSTSARYSDMKWQQPEGPTLITPILCSDCEYDPDGAKTKSGQIFDRSFLGENIQLVRDANGHVTDRFFTVASTGETFKHDVMGPFGRTEETTYNNGKLEWRQTFTYDEYGHLADWRTFDPDGKQVGRTLTNTGKDGIVRGTSVWGKDGELVWRDLFDPETQIEHFATFDLSGSVKLTWILNGTKLVSFWELPDSPPQFGENLYADTLDGMKHYACHSDGKCDISSSHRYYLDAEKRNLRSVEWRDADGRLRFASYFDYEIDTFGNWTQRKVWVWTRESNERALLETDSRAITYWQK